MLYFHQAKGSCQSYVLFVVFWHCERPDIRLCNFAKTIWCENTRNLRLLHVVKVVGFHTECHSPIKSRLTTLPITLPQTALQPHNGESMREIKHRSFLVSADYGSALFSGIGVFTETRKYAIQRHDIRFCLQF